MVGVGAPGPLLASIYILSVPLAPDLVGLRLNEVGPAWY